jgi:hypothetical protein
MPKGPKGEKRPADVIGASSRSGLRSPYRSGRSAHWIKVKKSESPCCHAEAEEDWGR